LVVHRSRLNGGVAKRFKSRLDTFQSKLLVSYDRKDNMRGFMRQ